MIPKSCRLFGQDHANDLEISSTMRYCNLRKWPDSAPTQGRREWDMKKRYQKPSLALRSCLGAVTAAGMVIVSPTGQNGG
jgi:hypothetical protein